MKRKHLNLLLAAVALGLVAAVYFSQEKPEPPPSPLTTLNSGDINRILIQHAGKPDIRLDKRKAEWWLVAPVETRAESVEVAAILDLATRPSQRRYPVSEMDLAALGLAEPDWKVQLNDVRIEFGATDPIEARRYVRLSGTVHLVEDPPSAALDADYNDLVARRLLPANARISRLQLPGLALTRTDKDGWTVMPKAADKGADAAQQLVGAWLNAQAMWITPLDRKRPTQGSIVIEIGDESFHFGILDRKDQLVLARPELGVQLTLSKTLDSDLFELKPPPKEEPKAVSKPDPHPNPLPLGQGGRAQRGG
ncbi:MAG: DUF4340 domain-containing protein [Nevskiales bacterium]